MALGWGGKGAIGWKNAKGKTKPRKKVFSLREIVQIQFNGKLRFLTFRCVKNAATHISVANLAVIVSPKILEAFLAS